MSDEPNLILIRADLCADGNVKELQELVEQYPQLINARNRFGQELLGVATDLGPSEVVIFALSVCSRNVDLRDHSGRTPLMSAVINWNGDPHNYGILRRAGADVNACAYDGRSVLQIAVESPLSRYNTLVDLIDAGATIYDREAVLDALAARRPTKTVWSKLFNRSRNKTYAVNI